MFCLLSVTSSEVTIKVVPVILLINENIRMFCSAAKLLFIDAKFDKQLKAGNDKFQAVPGRH